MVLTFNKPSSTVRMPAFARGGAARAAAARARGLGRASPLCNAHRRSADATSNTRGVTRKPRATKTSATAAPMAAAAASAATASVKVNPVATIASTPVGADAAWILTCSALVLFMTLPGLSAFYGGLVRRKNQLSVFAQCLVCALVTSVMWWAFGYSLCFSEAPNAAVGGLDKAFLMSITKDSLQETLPEALWALYQMTFAVITPALMIGAFVERMKFNASIVYMAVWSVLVYYPACHLIWGGGALAAAGVIDFAGGIVVHITAGIGALVASIVVGPRKENRMVPGNILLTLLGTGMLWVGWFGFNGGSAGAAGHDAAFANLVTHLSASIAGLVWMALDYMETKKTSIVGICTGCVAGLAAITPAAGSVGPLGGILMGTISALICRYFSTEVKTKFGYDDSLDVFGVHGVGGFVGTILLAVLGAPAFGGFVETPMMTQLGIQTAAALATVAYTGVASYLALKVTDKVCGGLRVEDVVETKTGLDQYCHGEACYSLDDLAEGITIDKKSDADVVPA